MDTVTFGVDEGQGFDSYWQLGRFLVESRKSIHCPNPSGTNVSATGGGSGEARLETSDTRLEHPPGGEGAFSLFSLKIRKNTERVKRAGKYSAKRATKQSGKHLGISNSTSRLTVDLRTFQVDGRTLWSDILPPL